MNQQKISRERERKKKWWQNEIGRMWKRKVIELLKKDEIKEKKMERETVCT